MSIRANLHTHTTYCDGKNTPREMVEAAIDKGFHTLGFSGHAHAKCDPECSMSLKGTLAYRGEITKLREEYKGKIEIFLGLENEGAMPQPVEGYDFIIGSVHYLSVNGAYYAMDASPEQFAQCIDECFGGNALGLAKAYYETLTDSIRAEKPDIVGHFDLIEKFNANGRFFDSQSPAYRKIALGALEGIAGTGAIVEINTGAMARGYTKQPYPAAFLIRRLRELEIPVIVSSDAHDAAHIGAYFDEMEELLRTLGFRERMELERGRGFVPVLF